MENEFHEANRNRWDAAAGQWAQEADARRIWSRCHRDPSLALHSSEMRWLADVHGQRVAVLGSGDNQVVFALAGMGARVTSVDISDQQIRIARERAASLRLEIQFVQSDVTDLKAMATAEFDLVFTGGHVAVWVSNLVKFYEEAARIIRPGGRLVVSEYHPFRVGWRDNREVLQRECNYFERGPHVYENIAPALFDNSPGKLKQFEFHWTVADYYRAVANVCDVIHLEEFGEAAESWEGAPLAGLPATLLIVGTRR